MAAASTRCAAAVPMRKESPVVMFRIPTLVAAAPPRPARQARPRWIALAAAVAATAISTGTTAPPASGQILPGVVPPVTPTVTPTPGQLLELVGGVSRGKLGMIEEEGYICFRAIHRIPPGMSWVCVPPLQ